MGAGAMIDVGGIADRVARGAARLDRKSPGWSGKIDVVRLNLANFRDCPLGQMYGHFEEGRDKVLDEDESAWVYGFCPHGPEEWRSPAAIAELTARWREAVDVRTKGRAAC